MALLSNRLVVVAVGALAVACSRAPAPRAPDSAAHVVQQPRDHELLGSVCPLDVAGTRVAPEVVETGAAYVFTTPGDVAELRRRVRIIARLHDERAGLIAATDDVPAGIRLNVRPADTTQIERMQEIAARVAPRLAIGSCPAIHTGEMVTWLVTDPRGDALSSR